MSRLINTLRGARKAEWLLLLIGCAILLALLSETSSTDGNMEKQLHRILSEVEGAGDVQVMVTMNPEGEAEGVLIVAEGAKDISVQLRLQSAVRTLLGIDLSRIEVVQLG